MKIYTKTGDAGETGLFGGERVQKTHGRIELYGTLDELNSCLGLALSYLPKSKEQFRTPLLSLERIQGELLMLGAELATPKDKNVTSKLIDESHVKVLEDEIDKMDETLSKLMTFILPGGSHAGAALHMGRTICRRAERRLVEILKEEDLRELCLVYVNRLSDYLFTAARHINELNKISETTWKS